MMRAAILLCLTAPVWSQCSGDADKSLAFADNALRQGNVDEAETIVTRVRTESPACSHALLLLGRAQTARHLPDQARESFTRYTQLEPGDAQGFEALAGFLAQTQDYSAAEQAVRKAVAISPGSVSALLLEGEILGRAGRENDGEAQRAFEQACKVTPQNPAPYFRLGLFFDSRGRRSEAVKSFRDTVARDPDNPTAWEYLALNLEQSGQPDDAEAAYKKGLAVNRGARLDPSIPYHYGKLLLNRNRLAESKIHLDQAAALSPDNGAVLYQRARLYVRMEKYAEARADAERVLALPDPVRYAYDVQLYYLLATIYGRLGEAQLAGKYAELARQARPPDAGGVR